MKRINISRYVLLILVACWVTVIVAQEPIANRLAIRTIDGQAEFYDTVTGERFIPRGTNYIDFQPTENGTYEDRVFATNIYDADRVRTAFRTLAEHGYNTARIFIDTCGDGPYCIGNPRGDGLNPAYLNNIVDVMHIAGEEGIYLLLTANSVPSQGGYWPYFDSIYYSGEENPFFEAGHLNGAYMVEEGFEVHRRYWRDLMQGIVVERDAPTEVLLGWQLFNEHWFFGDKPPFTLRQGLIELPYGTYDLASAQERRQMGIDATLHMMNELVPIIRDQDPETLITMGFFAPDFPNQAGFGGAWDTDTAPLLDTAPLDFFDFHAYIDTEISVEKQAENFGMIGYTDKPIIMGETGIGKIVAHSAQSATTAQAVWNAESCAVGFQGWLQWAYYPWPSAVGGKAWSFMDADGFMLEALSPHNQPDPCEPVELAQQNLAYKSRVTYSNQLPNEPASLAVDGALTHHCPGSHPPQWIQTNFETPSAIAQVAGGIASWPPGRRHVQIWANLSDGTQIMIREYDTYMIDQQTLSYDLPGALQNVTAVRFLTLEGDVWPCWYEVEVLSAAPDTAPACLIKPAGSRVNLRSEPTTNAEIAGSLPAGQAAIADEKIEGDDGFIWWHLTNRAWIRDDVAQTSDDCASLSFAAN